MNSTRRHTLAAIAAGIAVASTGVAHAAGYPDRPITLIAPFAAGGVTDMLARALAEKMGAHLHQAVVVDNKGGANTAIGAMQAARARPDGYTILFATVSTIVLNPLMVDKLGYDPTTDFEMISPVGEVPYVLVVPASSPARDLDGFIAYAKANKGKLSYGSVGAGSSVHLGVELFKQRAQIDLLHVPYKGSAPALNDLLAGRLDLMLDPPATTLQHIASGKLRAIAVSTSSRLPALPQVPALAERYSDYLASGWFSVVVPRGVSKDVKVSLKQAVDAALNASDLRERIEKAGFVLYAPRTEADIGRFLDGEQERWTPLVKTLGIRLDLN